MQSSTPTSSGEGPGTLTTTIQNPLRLEEPWTVTTIQYDNEEIELFIIRHRNRIAAVRKALAGKD